MVSVILPALSSRQWCYVVWAGARDSSSPEGINWTYVFGLFNVCVLAVYSHSCLNKPHLVMVALAVMARPRVGSPLIYG